MTLGPVVFSDNQWALIDQLASQAVARYGRVLDALEAYDTGISLDEAIELLGFTRAELEAEP